ncbi:hypothetical protein JAAARDRAFT_72123 [Jaapia argillacea MUCL 33604]|uniref:tripeptidyl-peptidase II n=1 Tax=Jaapia argillacea MUCL 33604 TaxID=933084 RepID=A0A067PRW7_9AGAM|nr:hypothetical protein JAAARDRAFT_72123 [Jaapia argillacea MUCL 33604]
MLPILSFALAALAATVSVLANPIAATNTPRVVHEKRDAIPSGWKRSRKHLPTAFIPLRFGLTQSNLDKLEDFLYEVSDPVSSSYGKHWDTAKVAHTFAPSEETVDRVRAWLADSGFETARIHVTPANTWVEVNATVEEAERLLATEYYVFEHTTGYEHVACDEYYIPEELTTHIDFITPTIHFNAVVRPPSPGLTPRNAYNATPGWVNNTAPWFNATIPNGNTTAPPLQSNGTNLGHPGVGLYPKPGGLVSNHYKDLEHCDQQITPDCLRALYGIIYKPLVPHKNSFGIVEYTPQAYRQSDLDVFFDQYSPNIKHRQPELVSIDGGFAQTSYESFHLNGESDLDLQYGMALTDRQKVTLYQVGDMYLGASFNNFLDAIDGSYCTYDGGDDSSVDAPYPDQRYAGGYTGPKSCGTTPPAHVISTSYAYNEVELSQKYTARQCAEYAKLGLMGVTVLYSSGDYGVAGNHGLCINDQGGESYGGTIFNPTFPSGCPYVTSVGATQINPGAKVTDPESACEQVIYSGGGFSNHFQRPGYQKKAVEKYLTNYPPPYPPNLWNTNNARAFPDLSANGANYAVAVDDAFISVYGTSASAPVVGAILTLVNDARLAVGKGPIGFINPTIYSKFFRGAFNDITTGGNQGCGTPGFQAAPGWDPVTGLGTPNFPEMLVRWLTLP